MSIIPAIDLNRLESAVDDQRRTIDITGLRRSQEAVTALAISSVVPIRPQGTYLLDQFEQPGLFPPAPPTGQDGGIDDAGKNAVGPEPWQVANQVLRVFFQSRLGA